MDDPLLGGMTRFGNAAVDQETLVCENLIRSGRSVLELPDFTLRQY